MIQGKKDLFCIKNVFFYSFFHFTLFFAFVNTTGLPRQNGTTIEMTVRNSFGLFSYIVMLLFVIYIRRSFNDYFQGKTINLSLKSSYLISLQSYPLCVTLIGNVINYASKFSLSAGL